MLALKEYIYVPSWQSSMDTQIFLTFSISTTLGCPWPSLAAKAATVALAVAVALSSALPLESTVWYTCSYTCNNMMEFTYHSLYFQMMCHLTYWGRPIGFHGTILKLCLSHVFHSRVYSVHMYVLIAYLFHWFEERRSKNLFEVVHLVFRERHVIP